MRSARLRHIVKLQAPTRLQDQYGDKRTGWADVALVWAGVEDITGKQSQADYRADQAYHRADKLVIVRWSNRISAIQAGWQVIHRERAMTIAHVDDKNGARRELHLYCNLLQEANHGLD